MVINSCLKRRIKTQQEVPLLNPCPINTNKSSPYCAGRGNYSALHKITSKPEGSN